MKLLRTMNTNAGGDSDEALLDNWPKGQAAVALDLDIDMPVTVGQVGGHTFTAADLLALVSYFLAVFTLSYGEKAHHQPYIGINGGKLRRFQSEMLQTECQNDFVGVLKAAAPQILKVRIRLAVNRKLAKGLKRFIGWTQGRTIKLETREGAANTFPAQGAAVLSRTVGVNCVIRVIPVYAKAGDIFSHFPHYREVNRAAQDASLPDGKPLVVWDDNAAADATAIGNYTMKVGAETFHLLLPPRYIAEDFRHAIDAGGSDFTDEVTPLFVAPFFEDERKLPTGILNIQMAAQDVAVLQARALYFPTIKDTEASTITAEAAEARNETVVATIANPANEQSDNGHTATAAIEFIGAGDPRQAVTSGLIADVKGNVTVHVPAHVAAMAAGAKNDAIVARLEKVTALAVPGSTATSGASNQNTVRALVRGKFAAYRSAAK